MTVKGKPKRASKSGGSKEGETLHVGIDLGTSRSAISPSKGKRHLVDSYVGWPRDFVSAKVLGKSVLFGADALEHRLSLDLYRPLEHGVIKETTEREQEAVDALIGHLLEQVNPDHNKSLRAVVGVPAQALTQSKLAIRNAVGESVDALMVVSEPFAVAYGQGFLDNAMVIDIGAGTVDFCIMHGAVPNDEDQRTSLKAGDHIDEELLDALTERYPEASINLNMAREFKEHWAFVGKAERRVEVDFPVNGRMITHDITEELSRACDSILPPLLEHTAELIAKFDPQFQDAIRQNIILAGGGSQIRGLAEYLERAMSEFGPAKVTTVSDPVYAGADGALELAKDMPPEYWEEV
ncbi:MAG: MamK family actin-like protein [Gammaproteobacteria bacterium]|nr:MamK family actin-like protein [Gammaproteobacteria bacterium]